MLMRHIQKAHAPAYLPPPPQVPPLNSEWAVDPDPAMTPAELVGRRVSVYWAKEAQWFRGTVTGLDGPKHVVHYDDGEELAEYLLGASPNHPRRGWRVLVPQLEAAPEGGETVEGGEVEVV
jgi:hypothetical protein